MEDKACFEEGDIKVKVEEEDNQFYLIMEKQTTSHGFLLNLLHCTCIFIA